MSSQSRPGLVHIREVVKHPPLRGWLPAFLLLFAFAFAVLRVIGLPISWSAYDRIETGMTEAEVTKVLGRPSQKWSFPGAHAYYHWDRCNGTAIVWFDKDGLVRSKGREKEPDRWLLHIGRALGFR